MQFFTFLTPWKICYWINDKSKIYFLWKWTWKCSHSSKTNIFMFLNFLGYPENAPNHILSSDSAGKILKVAIKSEPHGLCSWNFWNFLFSIRLSNAGYFKDFKIFDLTWIWWIWLEWPIYISRSFKTAVYGTFVRRMRKDVRYYFDKKIITSFVVEIRIAF